MIPFFRKIRKKMADDNRPLKYMRYAIGEIVLVVVGILIALAINNWNEDRVKKIALQEHLKNMVEGLNQDIEGRLTLVKNIDEFRFYAMLYLLDISGHEPNYFPDFNPDKDFVPVEWLWKGEIPTQYNEQFIKVAIRWMPLTTENGGNNKTILDRINDDGLFSYIEDPAIQSAIANNYGLDESRFGIVESQNIRKFKHDWFDAMNSAGFHSEYIKDPKEVIEWLENSPEAIAKLRNLASNAKWLYESCDLLIEDTKELKEDLNTYLLENK